VSRPRAHDVAIYAPFASRFYSASIPQSGGAELQTTLLARELARQGLRVAHVVYAVEDPVPLEQPAPTLVERPPWSGDRRLGALREHVAIWRGLHAADAHAYIVRGSGGHVVSAAMFCRAMRRKFVFSASNDLDFVPDRDDRNPHLWRAYRWSLRHSDRVVVQTAQQEQLARAALPDAAPRLIPSFAQPAPQADGQPSYFIWVNRLAHYKRPELYLQLAERLPDVPFRMIGTWLPGETPAEDAERLQRRAAELPNVELLSTRKRAELLAEIAQSAAVVSTSEAEGMPNTFLEAWARGVPVLSLYVDPDDRIAHDGVGVLADGSMERLTDAARQLWEDASLRRDLGARARDFVQRVHAPEAVGRRWVELLDEVLPR
jgi:glycosyltransferase involved in cell wall biosynthesis